MVGKSCDVNTIIWEMHQFNNTELRLIPSELDASVLDLTVIKSHLYLYIFPLCTNASSVVIGS